jgi:glycosyltransferase involved in cell wall biosynthesis
MQSDNKEINSPLFSVVIPAYNRANIISRAIDSVLAQTYTDFEIIVVDDGSTDNLKNICDGYNSSKISYCYQDNAGSNPARNTGIKQSRGYYVSFLDSDDTWEGEYLNEVAKKFASDAELGLVWVKNIKKFLPEGTLVPKEYKNLEGFVYREVLQQGYLINSSSITAKRSLLETAGGWDNNLFACQDDDICFRLAKITKIGCVDKILSIFYIDNQLERISTSSSRRAWNTLSLWQKFADDVISLCGKNDFEKKIVDVYSMFSRLKDKDGLDRCKQALIKYVNPTPYGLFVFRVKCIYKNFLFRKERMKKNIRRFIKRMIKGKKS